MKNIDNKEVVVMFVLFLFLLVMTYSAFDAGRDDRNKEKSFNNSKQVGTEISIN